MSKHKPYIKPETIMPEITVKVIILGLILSAILSAANAYLGLFLGMTVSASIPAAVISMALFRLFKNSTILENNAVQTAASAGESLAAGVIFTMPALILLEYWSEFNFIETTLIALCGGILGVLFTIPLRNALIVKENLKFPEGIATSEVLKTGEEGGALIKLLVYGSLIGAGLKFVISGMKLWAEEFEIAALIKGKGYLYFGTYLTPALIGVGYIVGFNISLLVFIGGAISWYIAIPAFIAYNGAPEGIEAAAIGATIWSTKIRYLGVGAMIVGGVWALVSIRHSLMSAIRQGIQSFKDRGKKDILRTDYDTPMSYIIIGIGVLIVPIFIIYLREIHDVGISIFMTILMIMAGFLFSAVAGYMAGLVGSSNNPISGVTIATILTSSLILAALIGTDSPYGAAAAIMIGAIVCCAAAIAGDNMQDLKSGYILGATPWKQQVMQVLGVVAAALVLSPVLNLLNNAYTIGSENLSAPQATLMYSVAKGVFGGELPWNIILVGCGIGILIIIIDQWLASRKSKFRMPVLAVAVGLYLPFALDSAIFIGGLIAWFVSRYYSKNKTEKDIKALSKKAGLLFASGLITGEALMGVTLALPIAATSNPDVFKFFDFQFPTLVGIVLIIGTCYFLYHTATKYKAE